MRLEECSSPLGIAPVLLSGCYGESLCFDHMGVGTWDTRLPANMCAHWLAEGVGGTRPTEEGEVCFAYLKMATLSLPVLSE